MKRLSLLGLLFLLTNLTFGQTIADKQTVIQMSIDLPSLQPYYVVEPPLVITDDGVVPANLTLTKFGESVEFMQKQDLFFHNNRAFLDFEKFDITPTHAEVVFRYSIKGLTITLMFEKLDGNWSIEKRTLAVD